MTLKNVVEKYLDIARKQQLYKSICKVGEFFFLSKINYGFFL